MSHFFDMLKVNALNVISSLCTFFRLNPLPDHLLAYLVDLTRKIIGTTVFDHSFGFSKAYDKFKRALNNIDVVVLVFFYIQSFEMHPLVYDKLLKALITFEWNELILSERSS